MSVIKVTELGSSDFAVCGNSPPENEEALTVAISNHQHKLYRIAFRMLRNAQDAQDALQDALLRAYRNLSQFRGQAQMSTWLTAIVMNSARMSIRRRSQRGMQLFQQIESEKMADAEDYFVDGRPDPEEIYGQAELQRELRRAAETLSPKVRSAFQLVVFRGMSIPEAAHTLGVSIGTIKTRVFHGRREVLRMLRASTFRPTARKSGSVSGWREQEALNDQPEAARVAA
jgi:RNA polymerase sigma-70 factor, ECF subfamily